MQYFYNYECIFSVFPLGRVAELQICLIRASRNLREREKDCRGPRATCANGKKTVVGLAQPARTGKRLLWASRNLREHKRIY